MMAEPLVQETLAGDWLTHILGKNVEVQWMKEETKQFFLKDDVQSTYDVVPDTGGLFKLYGEVEGRATHSWLRTKNDTKATWTRVEGDPMHGLRFVRAVPETNPDLCFSHVEDIGVDA